MPTAHVFGPSGAGKTVWLAALLHHVVRHTCLPVLPANVNRAYEAISTERFPRETMRGEVEKISLPLDAGKTYEFVVHPGQSLFVDGNISAAPLFDAAKGGGIVIGTLNAAWCDKSMAARALLHYTFKLMDAPYKYGLIEALHLAAEYALGMGREEVEDSARDAGRLLRALGNAPRDIVIVDYQLMRGVERTQLLRSLEERDLVDLHLPWIDFTTEAKDLIRQGDPARRLGPEAAVVLAIVDVARAWVQRKAPVVSIMRSAVQNLPGSLLVLTHTDLLREVPFSNVDDVAADFAESFGLTGAFERCLTTPSIKVEWLTRAESKIDAIQESRSTDTGRCAGADVCKVRTNPAGPRNLLRAIDGVLDARRRPLRRTAALVACAVLGGLAGFGLGRVQGATAMPQPVNAVVAKTSPTAAAPGTNEATPHAEVPSAAVAMPAAKEKPPVSRPAPKREKYPSHSK